MKPFSRANITGVPDNPGETLSDREILLQVRERVEAMWAEFEAFRPLLAMLKTPGGQPDMVGAFQLRRTLKKAGRHA